MTRALRSAAIFVALLTALAGTALMAQRHYLVRDVVISSERPQFSAAPAADDRSQIVSRSSARHPASGIPLVDPAWAARTARQAGIPEPAVVAYARATLRAPSGCGVGWTTLAGLGWVESQHGTIGGRTIGADGHSSTPILGPALDGNGLAAIRATRESTAWHGDPEWDHAVGPLQFIPSTWETWSSDGDGDGTADPNDLDDAAYAAARYLCADGYDLSTGAGWTAAVFAYNHAQVYVDAVYAAASSYADRTS
ncbi:lytic murein transglycosylase [Nocardioides sp.]|uniref:lytic murein transglycosylase n=1 Tax=Nocardioides sp. TaxID=35761 RepID=UPI0031FE6496|nr:Membrane-bound lytic murein transglycosylase B-like protein [Nocardioides sp.]